jgi:ZIP family zinc transporter
MPHGDAVALVVVVFVAKLAGGTIAVRRPRSVPVLSVLTGGVLLAAVFLQLLPEAVQRAGQAHLPASAPVAVAVLGVTLFTSVDGVLGLPRRNSQPGRQRALGIAGATIGVGLQVGTTAGLLAALAVAAHHLCEGLALVCYLFQRDRSRRRVVTWLALAALAPVAGALAGSAVVLPDRLVPLALGLFSGVFAFAAVSVLRHRDRPRRAWSR